MCRPDNSIELKCEECDECLGWLIPTNIDSLIEEVSKNNLKLAELDEKLKLGGGLPYVSVPTKRFDSVSYKIHCPECNTVSGPFFLDEDANYSTPDGRNILNAEYSKRLDNNNYKEYNGGINELWLQ